jgi:hypothetical protein
MSTKIAVNLPVKDLATSTRFFPELGFLRNERLATENTELLHRCRRASGPDLTARRRSGLMSTPTS